MAFKKLPAEERRRIIRFRRREDVILAYKKLPDEKKRTIRLGFRMTRHEYFILKCVASRLNMTLTNAVRRLVEEDNERHHYDLVEPEWMRPKNREVRERDDND